MARRRSLGVYHLHMGGWNGDALEWEALLSPRFVPRLRKLGVGVVFSAAEADIILVTGLLTRQNLDAVLHEVASMPEPSAIVAAGDAAIDGGAWGLMELPGLNPYPLRHYAEVRITVPGSPPTPQALLAALVAAASQKAPLEPRRKQAPPSEGDGDD